MLRQHVALHISKRPITARAYPTDGPAPDLDQLLLGHETLAGLLIGLILKSGGLLF